MSPDEPESRPWWQRKPLAQLVLARLREFFREPAAVFWVYGFPLVLAVALGIAFRDRPVERIPVDVTTDSGMPAAESLKAKLETDKRVEVTLWRTLPLRPSEYLARNVRATPLSGGNDSPLPKIMDELPDDMIVFSSDFPHFEGFTDPIGHYAQALKELSPARRERFYGGAIADVYARMGDPLAVS